MSICSIALLLSIGMAFPAMADPFPLKIVSNASAPEGKVFMSADFDQDGICDEEAVLVSTSTVQKIGIEQQCVLSSI
ncbi:hypothetical protein NsoK4_04665 [Nitrosopumilus sp. K4]|uniref:hypothetical protein n=1 Tax=Nitrosopumilus sp. K4 TaxID=2795383 RepID=UPI001BAC3440|nr:hypothetical protein [Nitrosopumilus sp. K4]QUC65533.1 hypothetical protein NsoK4_04665 [Nitrosopumilus sp. K4]